MRGIDAAWPVMELGGLEWFDAKAVIGEKLLEEIYQALATVTAEETSSGQTHDEVVVVVKPIGYFVLMMQGSGVKFPAGWTSRVWEGKLTKLLIEGRLVVPGELPHGQDFAIMRGHR